MLNFIGKLIILFGNICAIFILLGLIFLVIATFIINKDEIDYTEAIRELEESEGETNESDR
jgi:hypothetical protein